MNRNVSFVRPWRRLNVGLLAVLLGLNVVVSGCRMPPPKPEVPATAAERNTGAQAKPAPQPAATDEPAPIDLEGAYIHPAAHMVFPKVVGRFKQSEITRYDKAERDVSVGYDLVGAVPVVVTVYVYPAPRVGAVSPPETIEAAKSKLFEEHFKGVKAAVVSRHPEAKLVSDGEFTLTESGRLHKGREAVFEFEDDFFRPHGTVISFVYLFQQGEWFIKYRISYPRKFRNEVGPEVDGLMRSLVWPKE